MVGAFPVSGVGGSGCGGVGIVGLGVDGVGLGLVGLPFGEDGVGNVGRGVGGIGNRPEIKWRRFDKIRLSAEFCTDLPGGFDGGPLGGVGEPTNRLNSKRK